MPDGSVADWCNETIYENEEGKSKWNYDTFSSIPCNWFLTYNYNLRVFIQIPEF